MQAPKSPSDEPKRLQELRELFILDTAPEASYDNLTALLADALDVPIALVSLVDESRQWFKSRQGMAVSETPRDVSFCGHVVAEGKPLEVEDALVDPRFHDNPLVIGDPGFRFYAGWPVVTEAGNVLGTLCAIDRRPRQLTDKQRRILALLAQQVAMMLSLRRATKLAESYRHESNNTTMLLSAISRAQQQYIEDGRTGDVFDVLLKNLLVVTGSEYGFIGEVFRSSNGKPFLRTHSISNIAWSAETRAFYDQNIATGLEFHNLKTLFGEVLVTEAPVVSNNPASDQRRAGLPLGHPKMASFLGIPIAKNGVMLGMLGVANRPGGYSEQIVTFLEPFVSTCANIIVAHKQAQLRILSEETSRAATHELQAVNRELSRSNEDLAQFAYIVSHDLQAPLRHISTYTDIIVEELQGVQSSDVQQALGVMRQSVARLQEMIDDILAYSSAGNAKINLNPSNLNEMIVSLLDILSEEIADSRAEIVVGTLPDLNCDEKLISMVFQNLIQNAIKYRRSDAAPRIVVSAEVVDDKFKFVVADNGVGVAPEHHERMFRMFQRLPGTGKAPGSGIGLAICKKIIERHFGEIWVESEVGHGSRFCFLLPGAKVRSE